MRVRTRQERQESKKREEKIDAESKQMENERRPANKGRERLTSEYTKAEAALESDGLSSN